MEDSENESEDKVTSWKDYLGEDFDKPGICDTLPDYLVADIKDLKATENTTLRKVASPLEFPLSYEVVEDIVRVKMKFENDPNCFSMSAPQLGYDMRVMCYYKPTRLGKIRVKDKYPVYTLINPSYEPDGNEMMLDYEKCTSVKDVCALVPRFFSIFYKAYDDEGNLIEGQAVGAVARWIQHEIDHMNGLLFTDQANKIITIKEHRWRRRNGKIQWELGI